MQVKHCSEILQSVAAALTKAQQQHEEPVARAVAAVEAVAAAHSQLQVSHPWEQLSPYQKMESQEPVEIYDSQWLLTISAKSSFASKYPTF